MGGRRTLGCNFTRGPAVACVFSSDVTAFITIKAGSRWSEHGGGGGMYQDSSEEKG